MDSASEAKVSGIFDNCKETTVLLTILDEIGHPQPPTKVKKDKTTSPSNEKKKHNQILSKSIILHFY